MVRAGFAGSSVSLWLLRQSISFPGFHSAVKKGGKLAEWSWQNTGKPTRSHVFTQMALKRELPFFLICWFNILCYDSRSVS